MTRFAFSSLLSDPTDISHARRSSPKTSLSQLDLPFLSLFATEYRSAMSFVLSLLLPLTLLTLGFLQLCAVPSCPNPPERHRRARRFCTAHLSYHTLCGFVGCDLPRADEDDYDREEGDDDDEPTEACYIGAHQELWRRFRKRTKGRREMGWAGRKKGSGEKGEKYEVLGVDESEEGEGETEDDGSDVESEKRASQAEGKRGVSSFFSFLSHSRN